MLSLPKGLNEHYGKNVDKMPELLKAGEVPASVARIMQARLKQGNEFPDLWNKWYDSSDLVIYPKGNDKEVYVLLTVNNKGQITENGRTALELIREDNLASNYGGIVERIGDLGRKGVIKVPVKKIKTETYLTQKQILGQQVWRILARDPNEVSAEFAEDGNLLRDYVSEVQRRTGEKENMALYIGESLDDKTTLKAWCVNRLESRSGAGGRGDLDDDGRLVGLAPEALSAPGKGVGSVRAYSVEEILNETGFTDDFAPSQIKKLTNILEQEGYQIHRRK